MVVIVCMVGHDYQRILDGINHWRVEEPVERVYLLFDRKKDKYGIVSQKNVKDLENALSIMMSRPTSIGYNPQSYEDTFCVLYQILKEEVEENDRSILIDTTSTTKEAYGATVTISLMFRNVRIYIVPPKERGWYAPSPTSPNFQEWFQKTRNINGMPPQEIHLPGYRLEQPNEEERKIMLDLERHGGYSPSITMIMRWQGVNPRNPSTKNRFGRLIQRLGVRGLVVKEPSSRMKRVMLTPFGEVFAKAMMRRETKSMISVRGQRGRPRRAKARKRP